MVEEMVAALDEQDLEIILEDVKEDGVSGVIYNVRGRVHINTTLA